MKILKLGFLSLCFGSAYDIIKNKMKKKKYNGLNGVWDDFKKKFVKPGTIDWSWTIRLL